MTTLYFRNVKTGKRYQVIKMDKEKNEIVLKGEFAEFTEPYDKQRFIDNGYVLEKGEPHAQ
jgi:hypothetical protein